MIEGKIKQGDWFVMDCKSSHYHNHVYIVYQTYEGYELIDITLGQGFAGRRNDVDDIFGASKDSFRRYRPEDQILLKDKLGEISMSKFKEGDKVKIVSASRYYGVKNGELKMFSCPSSALTVSIPGLTMANNYVVIDDHNGGIWFFPEDDLELVEKRIKINFEGTEEEAINRFGKPVVDALKDCD